MESFINDEIGNLIKVVSKKYPSISYSELKVLLRKKDIKINGIRTNKDIKLIGGEIVEVYTKNKQLSVIYEDNHLCIVHKPVGIECTTIDKSYNGLSLEEMTGFFACHRLDMNTEGIVVLAKNVTAMEEMFKIFKLNQISKTYLCLVKGIIDKKEDTLKDFLVKLSDGVKVVHEPQKGAVQIITKYKVLKEFEESSLLEVELFTGKTHQIRAHLSSIGHFIIGDNKYGDKQYNKDKGFKKQCLCSYQVSFNNITGMFSYLNGAVFKTEPSFKLYI